MLELGGKAVLGNNIELTENLTISKDIILDLNGKAITNADSYTGGSLISVISGTLTVNDSQAEGRIETNTDQIINVSSSGALIVNSGSIASDGYAVYIDGAVTVNGGMISYLFGGANDGDISVTVTGGTILNFNVPSYLAVRESNS